MILTFICDLFFGLAHLLINLFPQFPSFDQLNVNLAPLFSVIQFLNTFIALPVVSKCLLVLLLVYNTKFVWSIVMWLVRKIPGVS